VDKGSDADFNWSVVPLCAFPLDVEAGGQALMLTAGLQRARRQPSVGPEREANMTSERLR
jgi:hypothetical protein